jgi:hypothetical protein
LHSMLLHVPSFCFVIPALHDSLKSLDSSNP